MTASRSSTPRPTGSVFVIDDEPDNRLILGDLLASRGHEVLEAADGERGLSFWPS
jgi:CheY-like chemotaxis protein